MTGDNPGFVSSMEMMNGKRGNRSPNDIKLQERKSSSDHRNGVYSLDLDEHNRRKESETVEAEYDPYNYREMDHPTTTWETVLHLLKGSLGTGILAMPRAFYNSGWLMGVIGTAIIGFLCTYCIRILVKSSYEMCKRRRVPSMSYPETAKQALRDGPSFFRCFADASPHIVNIFLLVYQLGTCCVYTLFIAEHLKEVGNDYLGEGKIGYYMLAILIPLIVINWIRNLKFLAPLSTLANIATIVSFAIIIYYILLPGDLANNLDNTPKFGKPEDLPLFFGTVLFALEAIGIMLPLVNEMKKPKSFSAPFGVLNLGIGGITLMYIGMGFFGYVRYGEGIQGSVVLNLPKNEIPAQIAQILLAFAIFVTHSLQFYVAIDIGWNEYIGKRVKESYQVIGEYLMRAFLVCLTMCMALAIPNIGKLIALFGALCLSALGLSFPAIIEICAFWSVQNKRQNSMMLIRNVFLILFGLLGLVVGTITSIKDILN